MGFICSKQVDNRSISPTPDTPEKPSSHGTGDSCQQTWANRSKDSAIEGLVCSYLTLQTMYRGGTADKDEYEYEHLYPVIAQRSVQDRLRLPPEDRIVYEPDWEKGHRHTYRSGEFRTSELTIGLGNQKVEWGLSWDLAPAKYEYRGTAEDVRFIPATNATALGNGDQFEYYTYFHELDQWKEYSIQIFYSIDENKVKKMHAVSIPLALLRLLLDEAEKKRKNRKHRGK